MSNFSSAWQFSSREDKSNMKLSEVPSNSSMIQPKSVTQPKRNWRKIKKKAHKTSLQWFLSALKKKINEDFLPKLLFTEVVQTQISFLAALGRILDFIQAESKACFKALTPSNLCRGNTCPWSLLSVPSARFSYFLPLLTHKGKPGRDRLLLLCCRPDSLRIGLARGCQMKGKKCLKKYNERFYILIMSHCIFYLQEAKIFTGLYTFTESCVYLSETEGKQ